MKDSRKWLGIAGPAVALLFLFGAVPVFCGDSSKDTTSAAPSVQADEYAGSDTCKTCHEDLYNKSFETTPHFKTTLQRGPRMRILSRAGCSPLSRWWRPEQNPPLQRSLRRTGECPMPAMSRRQSRTAPFQTIRSRQQRRRLPGLPFPPSCQGSP
jgi:hypothetical protein